ncbi:hypothetical protein [Streptomyces sp. NPDC096132]|uniref:hypothetical protein n=1 Tax=Streptomyces sp. NPDC096132 TaxID=3366075 RepID=UPI003810F664
MMADEAHSVEWACRVLHVAESGYYAWTERLPSARTVRHAWLTEAILGIHVTFRGTYSCRCVRAELTPGVSIHVHHGAALMLIRRAGLLGLPGTAPAGLGPKPPRRPTLSTATSHARRGIC